MFQFPYEYFVYWFGVWEGEIIQMLCFHSKINSILILYSQISYDPTEYVQKARCTKAAPPKPAYNPMQFVQIKPCNLYQSAQEQLKRSEEVKKVKEVKKEDAEEWQNVSRSLFIPIPDHIISLIISTAVCYPMRSQMNI